MLRSLAFQRPFFASTLRNIPRLLNSRFMSISSGSYLLTPAQVKALPKTSTAILDATWFMPNSPKNAREEHKKMRIPGAQYLDLDEVASPNELGLKHMMPSGEQFAQACEKFGVTKDHVVVLYDAHGIFSSPRALFMFKAFGHPQAFVLNGGLPAWRADGLEVESETADKTGETTGINTSNVKYPVPALEKGIIRSYEEILNNTTREASDAELVLDARSRERFTGEAPEPRPGLRSGHMPNSVSIPFTSLLQTHKWREGTYTTLLPPADLRRTLSSLLASESDPRGENRLESILRGSQPVIASCGSGMTAGVIWLALQEIGAIAPIRLYDESWTGYALRADSPIMDESGK